MLPSAEPGVAEPGVAEPGSPPTLGAGGGPVVLVRRPQLVVTIAGAQQHRAVGARCSFSFDQHYATAEITFQGASDVAFTYYDAVEVTMGAGNNIPRFFGYILPVDNKGWPKSGVLHCRGPLGVAGLLPNTDPTVVVLDSLIGTSLAGYTDQQQAAAILAFYGLLGRAIWTPTAGAGGDTLGGTGEVLGSNGAAEKFVWAKGQTGLAYLDALDAISVAQDGLSQWGTYRTFETVGGEADPNIWRLLITANPQGSPLDADFAFSEGVDVFGSSLAPGHDPTQVRNETAALGFDAGMGTVQYPASGSRFATPSAYLPAWLPNDPDTGYPVVAAPPFRSEQLERANLADGGTGIAAEAKARQLRAEFNTEVVTLRAVTYRDDLLGPGQTHYVYAPTRAGVYQTMWLRGLQITMSERRTFRQELDWIVKN